MFQLSTKPMFSNATVRISHLTLCWSIYSVW